MRDHLSHNGVKRYQRIQIERAAQPETKVKSTKNDANDRKQTHVPCYRCL